MKDVKQIKEGESLNPREELQIAFQLGQREDSLSLQREQYNPTKENEKRSLIALENYVVPISPKGSSNKIHPFQ